MAAPAFAVFDTAIGRCAIAWGPGGILGVQLPESREADTHARVLRQHPGAHEATPPPAIQRALDAIVALLRGERAELTGIALDMTAVPDFYRRVYDVARTVPPGATLTYGEVADRLGSRGLARAVGQALGRNPFPIVVPCHRVLAAGGRVGGFSAGGGITTKLRLLALEGRHATATPSLFDGDGAFGFDPAEAVAHVRASDPVMARLIDAVGPFSMELKTTPSLFVALAESIVYQQLTGRAAATIFARVRALFPRAHHGPTPEQILRVSDQRLRGAGLSNAKLLALRDLAQRSVNGSVPTLTQAQQMDDEAVIERLTEVRGIGRWTVEMLLMFRLGRPDVLPVDDYGVRQGFAIAYRKRKLPPPRALAKYGARWAPYRTVASWYLWRAVDLAKRGN
ncbi:MAG: methylated-DNA--[protein]-cysteine S-methyltransferase [Vicinamibacteria bacterium]|nr:methylated-DNA--[protein]-cysteine S-methyltransferase [Vicinamibacteria bacterium]